MSEALLPLTWQLHLPPGEGIDARLSSSGYAWLAELTEMRGRVLYDGGRRPAFRLADGSFADPDPLDAYAYHLLARPSACLVGCCRVVPLASAQPCGTESLLGRERFNRLLLEIGATRAHTGEASRWIVVPEHRGPRVGLRLVAGMWAIFRWLGLQTVIAMVGTRDGQNRALMRIGGRPVPGLAPLPSHKFDDEILVLSFDVSRPAKSFAVLIDEMAAPLGDGSAFRIRTSISNVIL